MRYNKPSLTFQQQIELLQSRGLVIQNLDVAKEALERISYYRLSAYLHFFQEQNSSNHQYRIGTDFDSVLNLYKFDKSLRMLVFNATESIEVAIRTQMIYQLSQVYGSHWYTDSSLFYDQRKHNELIDSISQYCQRKKVEEFIEHYRNKYATPRLPPSYMALEIISFGQLSRMYSNLSPSEARSKVHNHFQVPNKFFISWLRSLSHIRNICAHHSRLWNIQLSESPTLPSKLKGDWLSKEMVKEINRVNRRKIFIGLCCIQYLLDRIKPEHKFVNHLKDTFAMYPTVDIKNMGFPQGWENQSLWQ
ncbi:MAG: Abi family protein [Limnothrix sp.]